MYIYALLYFVKVLEAAPSEAHAISFVHTPIPHLHRERYTFSKFFRVHQRNEWAITQSITHKSEGVIPFSGHHSIRLVSCYYTLPKVCTRTNEYGNERRTKSVFWHSELTRS